MKRIGPAIYLLITAIVLAGCSAGQHARSVREGQDGDRVTVGTVQKEIRIGMSGAEVASVLGSPNIVTTDEKRREVWVYDKIATENVYSRSSAGVGALIFGGVGAGSGGAGARGNYGSGAASTSQRTFTVIIKYDEAGKVRDFAYNTTRF